jgi:predicted ArsR family transcriptional regulator
MFAAGLEDLVKPQWRAVLRELRLEGRLAVAELARRLEASYMAIKQHCEDLHELGYLDRIRVPRTEVGRPEIFYRLSAKAGCLFRETGPEFTLELLDTIRALFGENAPDRLLFLHFQRMTERWQPRLRKAASLVERATLLAGLRESEGSVIRCRYEPATGFWIEEFHHPLQKIMARYPRVQAMDLRMMEQLLGERIQRREIPGGPGGPSRIEFHIATLGS